MQNLSLAGAGLAWFRRSVWLIEEGQKVNGESRLEGPVAKVRIFMLLQVKCGAMSNLEPRSDMI